MANLPHSYIERRSQRDQTINKLETLGVITDNPTRSMHVGDSDYSKQLIQPWTIWQAYKLDPWDADIIKRVLRTKQYADKTSSEARIEDYEKIIHNCQEKMRQLHHGI